MRLAALSIVRRITIALAAVMALPLAAQTELDVRFGILVAGSDGEEGFVETAQVPNVVGQTYGWVATIEALEDPITWTEELRLPKAPLEWDVVEGPAVAVSDDRTAARSSGVILPTEREFSNFWSITPGDPNGAYSFIVKVSDGVVAQFTFNVVAAQ